MASHSSQLKTQLDLPLPADKSTDDRSRSRDLRSPASLKLRRGVAVEWLRTLAFVSLDCILLFLSWQVSHLIAAAVDPVWNAQSGQALPLSIIAIEVGVMAVLGLYQAGDCRRDYSSIIKAITLVNALTLLITAGEQVSQPVPQSIFILSWLLGIIFVCLGRFLADVGINRLRKNGVVCHSIFILCKPEDADLISATLKREPHYTIVGWRDSNLLIGNSRESLIEEIFASGVSEVFLCSPLSTKDLMLLYWDLRNAGVTLHLSFLLANSKPLSNNLNSWQIPELVSFNFSPPLITGIDFWVKRVFDFCAAAVFLLLVSPIYIAVAAAIKLDSSGPIFYRQTRIGLRNQPFKVWKFRTMVANADKLQKQLEALNETKDGVLFKMKHDPRVTRVGRFLRQYSLDELPQVFNVLLGEMSFVGPRPLPVRDVEKFSESHFVRHEVLPGITGLWQVSGRSNIENFDQVITLDMSYIKNWSLWLDLQIVLQTVKVVLQKTGAY